MPVQNMDDSLSNFDVFLSNEIFSSLDQEGRQKIARLLKTLHFRPGEYMLRAGEKTNSGLYIVMKGQLDALVHPASGETQVVGVLGPGAIFGEMELLTGQTRQASIQGKTSGELVYLPKSDFEQIIQDYSEILNQMGEIVHRRFRRNQLAQILPSFLARFLLKRLRR
ncbi:MAG: cyclic nucleotide-binding domain-containing protein [Anaerolineae bacterium]|nr:cyclic nucleotide-binding domain-containing protein [Anaerolineae bacterium]